MRTILLTLLLLLPIAAHAGMNIEYYDGDQLHVIAKNIDREFLKIAHEYQSMTDDPLLLHRMIFNSIIRMERHNGKHVYVYHNHRMNVWKDSKSWVSITVNGRPVFKVTYTGHAKYLVRCPGGKNVQVEELKFFDPANGTWAEGLAQTFRDPIKEQMRRAAPEYFTGNVCTSNTTRNVR